jgi:hypothetical protein
MHIERQSVKPLWIGLLKKISDTKKKKVISWALVAHTGNPSYSGRRGQEDCGLKPAWANSSRDAITKKPFTKIGLVEWLKVNALSSSPSTAKKKKKKKG